MSAPGPLSNGGVSQSIWGPRSIKPAVDSSIIAKGSVRRKQRKRKIRKEKHDVQCQEMYKLEKSKKRKSSQFLDEQTSEISSSENCGLRPEAPSDISFNSTHPVKAKKAKITTPISIRTGKCASLSWEIDSGVSSEASPPTSGRSSPCIGINPSVLVAMDCEMVGTGPQGRRNEVARCSIVNYYGTVIYDQYILPLLPVTNYRTRWSGIREELLKDALPYEKAKEEILQILKGKVIIGHALHNDFRALGITVPRKMTRDTLYMRLLQKMYDPHEKHNSLKKLARKLLDRSIQVGRAGHCSVEDARAALDLYKLVEEQWEKSLQSHSQNCDFVSESASNLEHYMEDQYWPENMTDSN